MSRIAMLTCCVVSLVLGTTACFNGPGASTTIHGGSNRLMLVVEPSRTDLAGTHFLIDTINGDLWRLDASANPAHWVRAAQGPADLADFEVPGASAPADQEGA